MYAEASVFDIAVYLSSASFQHSTDPHLPYLEMGITLRVKRMFYNYRKF